MQIDHVHFSVKDAVQTSNWFIRNLGFQEITTSTNDHTYTKAIANKSVFLVFSSPLKDSSPVAHYLNSYSPGVSDIAFQVNNLETTISQALSVGCKILEPLQQCQLPQGNLKWAKITGWNSLEHTLIENAISSSLNHQDIQSLFCYLLPNNQNSQVTTSAHPHSIINSNKSIIAIDHVVLNVPVGKLRQATSWYKTIFGFQIQQTFNIKTKRSGLYSQALVDPSGKVQLNLNEPTSTDSQIQEFLDHHRGAGIQHIALRSHNIIETVAQMRFGDVSFLPIPQTYYTQLQQRFQNDGTLPLTTQEWEKIKNEQILIDWNQTEPNSLLMQIFTEPIFEKPTFFLELIERRKQAKGFGEGNFQALFEAVEREQLKKEMRGWKDVEHGRLKKIVANS
ncbi:4-hydroxyphenylpyruvate dioxygenase [Stanieria cyanosphaera PCC 7437]|uniref:4-hydroxyphenylpyruvate dioxygenase n=1 Tax=Stanieria cyanosphaera (strain ATCC 29371 / PCC 7437) TaxID=111780 RepID=K9XYC7_STAC7|nr:4-hydroxyphenylpyruvate dioxygenase [Stanieria cyanosphaera]AFZ36667.1 4-hydroxyphenylpyruvate dioxygenase [Stanieria cyanosphaera PCC 7437]